MNADGRNPRNLTRSPLATTSTAAGSCWSPDGRRIAFATTRDTRDQDNPELYVMNADGTNVSAG